MGDKTIQRKFELRRRIDGVVYCFEPCKLINGQLAWKREDADMWVTYVKYFGWVCINSESAICGIPWSTAINNMGELPPAGEWVSKKGDKSYVYDFVYM